MAKRRFKRAKRRRRRRSLSASNWGPIIKLVAVILGFLALLYVILYVAVPKVADIIGIDYRAPFTPEATPSPTPVPTPTPHPMKTYDFSANTQELVFDGSSSYKWFTDPYFYDGRMIISAGKLASDGKNVAFGDMFFFDPENRSAERLNLSPQNSHFMYPRFNSKWLVYLDANMSEGGAIMAVDLTASTLKPVKVKDVYSGQPEPFLSDNYVAFIDRTGTTKDKLFVYDLTTMESTVVAMFTNSVYGQSKPFIHDSTLIWADSATSEGSSDTSLLNYIYINSSTVKSVNTGTFIHDPECNSQYIAWLNEVHSRDTQLYGMNGFGGSPFLIDSGVVEFGLGSDFVAYSRDEGIYVYMFDNGNIYRLTQDYEQAMFLGVSDDHVMWMDVTSRERDIVKFIEIP